MEQFVVGDVVVVSFPFSDLRDQKLRPALVLAQAEFKNLILCQITSKRYASTRAIALSAIDFSQGGLPIISYVRPDKIFTADPKIIRKTVGRLNKPSLKKVLRAVQKLFSS